MESSWKKKNTALTEKSRRWRPEITLVEKDEKKNQAAAGRKTTGREISKREEEK